MSQVPIGRALDPLGWSDRVEALYKDVAGPTDVPGRVVRVARGISIVVGSDGVEAKIRTRPPGAVGDWVVLRDGAIVGTLPRWSALTRQDPDGTNLQTLASNIDLVLIAAPADRLSLSRVERELVVAWDSGARPVVVLTKSDLATSSTESDLRARLAGVDVIASSVNTSEGIEEILRMLRPDRSAVLLGPSGAGKSSLVNAILGSELLAVGVVRDADRRGRHTTSSRQLLAVPGGGVLIDTPGLRGLGLSGDGGLDAAFPDIETLALQCRFSDCRHEVEPDCAVIGAMRDGSLDPKRVDSFRKLHREVAANERNKDPLVRKEELRLWKLRISEGRAKQRPR